jgi:hypothetical protein
MPAENALPALLMLVWIPAILIGLAQMVCLVIVIVEMFKRGETAIGIVCAVLSVCTGVGALIAFVYGWIKSSEWGLRKVMLAWTICLVINLVLAFAAAIGAAMLVPANQQQLRQVEVGTERFIA